MSIAREPGEYHRTQNAAHLSCGVHRCADGSGGRTGDIDAGAPRGAEQEIGERGGKRYQLADRVEVRLVEVAPLAGAMRFEMLTPPKPLPGSRRSFHKAKKGRARATQPRHGSRGRRR